MDMSLQTEEEVEEEEEEKRRRDSEAFVVLAVLAEVVECETECY